MFNSRVIALAALNFLGVGGPVHGPDQAYHGRGKTRSLQFKKNGKRECERRQRQILAGELTIHNGLDTSETAVEAQALPPTISDRQSQITPSQEPTDVQ